MKKLRCPACKEPLVMETEPAESASFICSDCGEVAVFNGGRMHPMTVKDFVSREADVQKRIRRAIAKAAQP